jgi:speckle-type POZ protein
LLYSGYQKLYEESSIIMSTNAASAVGISSSDGEALTTSAIVAEAVTGSHVLQIKGYSRTKGLGSGKFINSSTFCLGGHRWFIRYYPDGDGVENADWVSLFLHHDNTNDVDVKARLKFSVLYHTGEPVPMFSKKTSTTFSPNRRSWGFDKFVARKELELGESSYLKDDCLKEPTMQFVVVPPSNMHRHFGSLLSGAVGADVTFEVAGEMFAAHRGVLAARSSVFMAELYGPMKEKAMNCIRIRDMEARVFKAMLHFIYTDTMPEIDKEDVFVVTQHLLVAADRYDLERLKLICEDRLCMCIDTSTVATTLAFAERHGCHGLKNACFQLLKSPSTLETVMATESFDHLMTNCPSLIKELLAKMATCP